MHTHIMILLINILIDVCYHIYIITSNQVTILRGFPEKNLYIHNTDIIDKYCCFIITFVRYLSSISSRKPRRVGVQVYLGAVNKPERPTHTSLLVFMFSWLKKKTPAELLRWAWLDPDPLLSTSNRVHVLNNSLCFWVWIKDNRFTSIFKTVSWHQGTMHFH